MPTYDSHCDVCGLYRRCVLLTHTFEMCDVCDLYRRCVLLTHTFEMCEGCLREGLSELNKPAQEETKT